MTKQVYRLLMAALNNYADTDIFHPENIMNDIWASNVPEADEFACNDYLYALRNQLEASSWWHEEENTDAWLPRDAGLFDFYTIGDIKQILNNIRQTAL